MKKSILTVAILSLIFGIAVPAFAYENGEEIPPEKVAEVQREIDAYNRGVQETLEVQREKFDRENRIVTGADGIRRQIPGPDDVLDMSSQGFVDQTIESKMGGDSYEVQGVVRPKFGTKILPTPKTLNGNPVGLSDWETDKKSKAETPIIEEKPAVIDEPKNELPNVLVSYESIHGTTDKK